MDDFTKNIIEKESRRILEKLWTQRKELVNATTPSPFDLLEPTLAASELGLTVDFQESLGTFGFKGQRYEVAGSLSRENNLISISFRFPEPSRRFTLAHEIGHYLLHPGEKHHRDRPLDAGHSGPSSKLDQIELEANYFAACLLAPTKLVKTEFRKRFLSSPFVFTDETAWLLDPASPEELLRASPDEQSRELKLATARQFNGRHFSSMCDVFKLSPQAMAIRIRECSLIRYP